MGCCESTDALAAADAMAEQGTPTITLSSQKAGPRVQLALNTGEVQGHGSALSSAAIDQDKSYWEVQITNLPMPDGDIEESPFAAAAPAEGEAPGVALCRVGVCERLAGKELEGHLPSVDDDEPSAKKGWVVESCVLYAPALAQLRQGDVVGIAVQLSGFPMVQFYLNGSHLSGCDVGRISGTVFAGVSVSGGASVAVHFEESRWGYRPPSDAFSPILQAQNMI